MLRFIVLLVCPIALGCAPEVKRETDEDLALLRTSLPGINERCVNAFRKRGIEAIPQDARECFPMENSKRWTGLWSDEFEASRFCATPAERCDFESEGERVWLSFADEIKDQQPDRHATDALYEIEFIGRQTSGAGAFGHDGASEKEIVVEKLIRLERASGS